MGTAIDDSPVTLVELPWEDVIFKHIFCRLDMKTIFSIGSTSSSYRTMIEQYFRGCDTINVGKHGGRITEKALHFLLKDSCRCQKLFLQNCKSSLTDQVLEPMLGKNSKLSRIDLTQCTSLTNNSLQTLATSCQKISQLSLRDCVWASPPAVTNIGLQCPGLVTLDLSGCWNIDDDTVSVISQSCVGLTDLNVSRIYGITDISVKAVARNCGKLKKLNIRECWRVTDSSMQALLEYCQSLRLLQIKGCRSVTWRIFTEFKKKGVLLDNNTDVSRLQFVRSEPPVQI